MLPVPQRVVSCLVFVDGCDFLLQVAAGLDDRLHFDRQRVRTSSKFIQGMKMVKIVKSFLKTVWRCVCIVALLLLGLVALILMSDVPGSRRFARYRSYPDLASFRVAESNDIWKIVAFQQDGTNYTAVAVERCRCFASGPAVLIYDEKGKLFDWCRDVGDYSFRRTRRMLSDWNFSFRGGQ